MKNTSARGGNANDTRFPAVVSWVGGSASGWVVRTTFPSFCLRLWWWFDDWTLQHKI